MKLKPDVCRQVILTKRTLRRAKRGRNGTPAYERSRLALTSLTELEGDPMRPGLAAQVAMNVRRAI